MNPFIWPLVAQQLLELATATQHIVRPKGFTIILGWRNECGLKAA